MQAPFDQRLREQEANMRNMSSLVSVFLFALGYAILELSVRLFVQDQLALDFVAWSFAGGILVALLLAWMLPETELRRLDLIAVVWLVLFIVARFNNVLEGYFFTSVFASVSVFVSEVFLSLLTTLVQAIMAGVLFIAEVPSRSLISDLSSYVEERKFVSWAWRIVAASIVYFPVYFIFGALISPFVVPYYTNPSSGLKIPSFTVIIPLELLRGFLYVISLLSLFATIRGSRKTVFAAIASVLYVPGALVPLMVPHSLPAEILPFHLVEILADSIVYGALITWLLSRKSS
jgi:hypothetical protein